MHSKHREELIRTFLNLTPLLEMPPHNFLRLRPSPRLLYPPNVQRSVLPRKRTYTTHIISVVGELVTGKTVLRRIRDSGGRIW